MWKNKFRLMASDKRDRKRASVARYRRKTMNKKLSLSRRINITRRRFLLLGKTKGSAFENRFYLTRRKLLEGQNLSWPTCFRRRVKRYSTLKPGTIHLRHKRSVNSKLFFRSKHMPGTPFHMKREVSLNRYNNLAIF